MGVVLSAAEDVGGAVVDVVETVAAPVADVVSSPVQEIADLVNTGQLPLLGGGGGNIFDDIVDIGGDIVDFAGDAVGEVVDVVEDVADVAVDAFEWIGETVVDAAEWTYDEILEPVVGVAEGIVQGAIDDPLGTAIMIAAASTGNPFIIAAAAAARTAINGGSVEEMLISAGTSYLGAEVGSFVGDYIGSTVASEAGATAGRIAAQSAAGATRGAITAAATGESIEDAALRGAVNGAAAAGVSSLGSYVRGQVSPTPTATTGTAGAVDIDVDPDSFNSTFTNTYDSVSNELSSLVDGFDTLPNIVQNTITSGAAAAITSYVETGEVNEDVVAAQMFNSAITAGMVRSAVNDSEYFDQNTTEGRTRTALLTQATNAAVASAFTGADPSRVIYSSLQSAAASSLNQAINDISEGGLLRAFDEVAGTQADVDSAYANAQDIGDSLEDLSLRLTSSNDRIGTLEGITLEDAAALDALMQQGDVFVDRANNLREQRRVADNYLNGLYERKDQLDAIGSSGTWSAEYQSEYDFLIDNINSQVATVNSLNSQYNDAVAASNTWQNNNSALLGELTTAYDNSIAELQQEVSNAQLLAEQWNALNTEYSEAVDTYNTATEQLVRDEQYVDELIVPITEAAQRAVVDTITADPVLNTPQFNPDEYREMYGLTEDQNPYTHWLETGRTNYVNQEHKDTADKNFARSIAQSLAPQESNVYQLATTVEERLMQSLGLNEFEAGELAVQSLADLGLVEDPYQSIGSLTEIPDFFPTAYDLTLAEGVTKEDVLTGRARARVDSINARTGEMGVTFIREPEIGGQVFDPVSNLYVRATYDPISGQGAYFDVRNGELVSTFTDALITPEGELSVNRNGVRTNVRNFSEIPLDVVDTFEMHPVMRLQAAGMLGITREDYDNLDPIQRNLYKLATNINEWTASASADPSIPEAAASNRRQAANAIMQVATFIPSLANRAATFLYNAQVGDGSRLLPFTSEAIDFFAPEGSALDFDPADPSQTWLGRTIGNLRQITQAGNTAEVQDTIRNMDQDIAGAPTWLAGIERGFNAISDAPGVVLFDKVGGEWGEELLTYVVGASTGLTAANQAVRGGRIAAEAANRYASRVGFTTVFGINVADEITGAAEEAYTPLYQAYMETVPLDMRADPDVIKRANEYAATRAANLGLRAGLIEGSLGAILPASVFKQWGFGDDAANAAMELSKRVRNTAVVTGAEAVSESFSEASTAIGVANYEAQLDPSVLEPGGKYENFGAYLSGPMLWSALAGSTVAGTTNTAAEMMAAVDAGTYTSEFNNVDPAEWASELGSINTGNPVADVLLTYNPALSTAYTNTQSTDPNVRAAGEAEIQDLFGWDQFFDEGGTLIDLSPDAQGIYSVASDTLNTVNDSAYTTPTEVRETYSSLSETAPIQLSDAELLSYTGQRPDENLVQDIRTDINRGYIQELLDTAGLPSTDADVDAALTAAVEQYDVAPDAMLDTRIGSRLAFQYNPSQAVTDIVASQLGRPGQAVTEQDIANVADVIARQDTATEPLVYTEAESSLDVNNDGVIDINDQIALQTLQTQQQTGIYTDTSVSVDPLSPFAPTGVYAELERQRAAAARQRQRANVGQLIGMLQGAQGPKLVAESPEVKDIEYYYNPYEAESIFATPKQAGIFGSELAGDNPNSANDDFLSQLRRATGGI